MRNRLNYLLLMVGALLIGVSCVCSAAQQDTLNDQDVKLVSFEDLLYPPAARMARVQGVVVVKVTLDDDGKVASAFAISGNKTLIPDTLANAKKWRFKSNPQKSAVIVYEFSLTDGACHDNSHSLFQLIHPNFVSITACSPVING
jgi:TonB family protein